MSPAPCGTPSAATQAMVLHGVLPYLRSVQGRTFVVVGAGRVLGEESLRAGLARDTALLSLVGLKLVLVGSASAGAALALARLTDTLVGLINQQGLRAVGVTGIDGGPGGPTGGLIQRLHADGFVPVVMPLGADHSLADADALAADVAVRLGAEKLLLLGDDAGVPDRNGREIPVLSRREAERRCREGTLTAAALGRLRAASAALAGGVRSVHVVDGAAPHALLLEVLSRCGGGTLVLPDKAAGFLDDTRRSLG